MSSAREPLPTLIPGATAVVDRVDRDTIALTRVLVGMGARVTLLRTRVAEEITEGDLDRLEATLAPATDTSWARPGTLFFAHDYSAPSTPALQAARRAGCRVTHLAELLLDLSPGLTIGVTGSAGKSTTAALIGAILRAAGRPVYMPRQHVLSGSANPNWEMLEIAERMDPSGVCVMELTSSHLEYMSRSTQISVVTTFTPDHVEWHGSVAGYRAAKRRIVALQRPADIAVLNADEPLLRDWAQSAPGCTSLFSLAGRAEADVRVVGENVVTGARGAALIPLDQISLPDGYLANALAATAAALAAGAPRSAIQTGLGAFVGLPGRREQVGCVGGVAVYHDGLAITPRKATASLSTFPDQSVLLLCGGDDVLEGWSVAPMHSAPEERRLLAEFAHVAARKARGVFTLGSGGDRLREELVRVGIDAGAIASAPSLEDATQRAIAAAQPGDHVLLAPVFDIGDAARAGFPQVARAALDMRRSP